MLGTSFFCLISLLRWKPPQHLHHVTFLDLSCAAGDLEVIQPFNFCGS